ncbi:MAG: hypothetical protein ACXWZ6_08965 [Solirubrobacterales bacterium]
MEESPHIRITLELEPADGPPAGRASAGGSAREFSGWLGLMSAIDALVIEAPARDGRDPRAAAD